MISYSWLIFYNKCFMIILYIYNTLNINVLCEIWLIKLSKSPKKEWGMNWVLKAFWKFLNKHKEISRIKQDNKKN